MTTKYQLAAAFAVALVLATSDASAQGLPGGASSLNEAHGDWTVTCVTVDGVVRCVTTQTQVSGENRQRVLAIEITSTGGGSESNGVLILPFGLKLSAGVRLAIEDGPAMPVVGFSTCLPSGCVVPVTFDAATVVALKAASTLTVAATANDNGQEVALSISLNGFASALDRVAQLGGE